MKTIQYAYAYGISLQNARHLTGEEKTHYNPEYQESVLIAMGDYIDLPHITWQDLTALQGRETYSFPGCGNRSYEITDAEWDAFITLNNARAAESDDDAAKAEINAAMEIITKAEAQADIPTAAEAADRIKQYNNVYNEGGEGYVPEIITAEQYEQAKAVVQKEAKDCATMTATLYIIKDDTAIQFGFPACVVLDEPHNISSTWVRRVTVELPDGFAPGEAADGCRYIYRNGEHYALIADAEDNPVIIDHHDRGAHIQLPIISKSWDD